MNGLTKFLVEGILGEEKKEVVALYAGGFKPPTAGHFLVVEEALKQYPEIDKLVVLVGSGIRDGIEQTESILVWETYQNYLPMKVEIQAAKKPPINAVYSYAKDNPEETIYWILGAREGKEEDTLDIAKRTAAIDKKEDKYNNVEVKIIRTSNKGMSGTNARKALRDGDKEAFSKFIPTQVEEKDEIFNILRPAVTEGKDPKKGTGKKPKGSSRRLYTDEDPKDTVGVKFSSRQDIVDTLNKKSFKAKSHARQSQIINLIHQRVRAAYNRAKDPDVKRRLKTALDYAEERKEASKAKTQRLKKQKNENVAPNHDGKAAPFGSGYDEVKEQVNFKALEKQLDNMFAELDIDVAFTNHFKERVIERGLTEEDIIELANKIIDKYPDELDFLDKDQNIVMSHLSRLVDIAAINTGYGDDYLKDLVFKTAYKRKDKSEPEFRTNKSSPRLAVNENTMKGKIDILPKIGELTLFMIDNDMNVEPLPSLEIIEDDVTNAEDFFGKTAYYDPYKKHIVLYTHGRHPKDIVRSYAHEMIHHIQNLEGRLGNITTTNTQEDDHLNDIEAEANLNGTMTFRNWTDSLNEDTLGLEEEILTEGRYDKLVNQLSKIAFETIKDGYDIGRKVVDLEFSVGPDDEDIISNDFEFDFNIQAEYTEDEYEVDGGANAGFDDKGEEITPLINVRFKIPKNIDFQEVSFDLKDVIRHELEHLTQDGANIKPGKQMEDDQLIRKMIDSDVLSKAEYFKLEKEVDAMLQGLYFKAKKSKRPYIEVIDDYLDKQPISQQEREDILDLWRSRIKSLSLPLFENEEKVMDYRIFLDMDGVLVDFDQQFKDLTGMMPREFESKYSTEEFWETIDKAGVGFWRGMKWMPGGEALYNRAAQHDHFLLSSPSRSEVSKIGKRLWRRDKTPNTKLYLARSYNKRKFAAPNHILIDDRADNIQQWKDAGGIGILYKSADQVNTELDKLGL